MPSTTAVHRQRNKPRIERSLFKAGTPLPTPRRLDWRNKNGQIV
jgi:hypothetical protein